jgi:hypothetical protein
MHLQSTVDRKFRTVSQVDLFQVERSKMNQTSERKCKMQQQMPKIVLLAVNISATLHRRGRKDQSLKDACLHNVNSVCVCVSEGVGEKTFPICRNIQLSHHCSPFIGSSEHNPAQKNPEVNKQSPIVCNLNNTNWNHKMVTGTLVLQRCQGRKLYLQD